MIGRPITTEHFKRHFRNNFDLTNFAIQYAREFVMSGQEGNLDLIMNGIAKEIAIEMEKEQAKELEKNQ